MTTRATPRLARMLLRLVPLGERRAEVAADLDELFDERVRTSGIRYARRRYYGDVCSLWRGDGPRVTTDAAEGRRGSLWREGAQDVAYALRLARRGPGSVAIAVVGLGLAIGVGTSVFSLVNAIAFRSTGVLDPASTFRVLRAYANGVGTSWRYAEYRSLQDGAGGVALDASFRDDIPVRYEAGAAAPVIAGVTFVTGGYLSSLNDRPAHGRLLLPSDDQPGAAPVVVVSYGVWMRVLSADPAIVGRPIWLNGVRFTIVGVTAAGFTGGGDGLRAIWVPMASYHLAAGGPPLDRHVDVIVTVTARLGRGMVRGQAEAALSTVAAALAARLPDPTSEPLTGVRFVGLDEPLDRAEAARVVLVAAMVTSVVALVLLLACVNVTNLLLASAIARQRELGVRLALGASRWRLVRQLMTESLLLGIAGGVCGLIFSIWGLPILAGIVHLPSAVEVERDGRVYLVLAALSLVAGLGAGLVPARQAMRDAIAANLKGGFDGGGASSPPVSSRSVLVAVQAAASLVLLVVAALLTRGLVRATHVDVGFDADRLVTISSPFARQASDAGRTAAYWDSALERVRALPGVTSAALAETTPFGTGAKVTIFRRAGGRYTVFHNATRAEFFATVGLRAVRGRTFTAAEVTAHAPVAVISETVARDFFPGEDPIGQPLTRVVDDSGATIVGVVSDAITARLRELGAAIVYEPMGETSGAKMIVRSAGPPEALVPSLRRALQPLVPGTPVNVSLVRDGLQQELGDARALATVAGALAAIALALAVVGLYGMTAFIIGRRTREIGLRMALGADARAILQLLVGDSLRPVCIGLAAGVAMALLIGRAFAGVLFGITPTDPLAFAAAILILTTAALAAVLVPARHASGVDPATVLRQL